MSTVSLLGLRMSSINAEQLQISDACQKWNKSLNLKLLSPVSDSKVVSRFKYTILEVEGLSFYFV